MNKFISFKKEKRFDELCNAAGKCELCPRLRHRKKVLSLANGDINSKLLFIAEAPGRLGADRTGIPLYGDRTGNNFENLLKNVSWSRNEIFITNAILCNPRESNGNNDTPSRVEIKNCSYFLQMTIELIQPPIIVTLGKSALTAVQFIYSTSIELKQDVGKLIPMGEKYLVPLYHPGPRALIHRSLPNQRADFIKLAKYIHPKVGIRKNSISQFTSQTKLFAEINPTPLQKLTTELIGTMGRMSYFKLTKMLFLIDLLSIEKRGHSISKELYIRQVEGPWPPKLFDQIKELNHREVTFRYQKRGQIVEKGSAPRFNSNFDMESLEIIYSVINKYGLKNNSELKTAAYLTRPMRYILKQEKAGKDMRNAPLIYKDKIVTDTDSV